MMISNKKEGIILFSGDIFVFIFALWTALCLRYLEFPSFSLFFTHLKAFSLLFVVWTFIFFVAGLYEKNTLLFKSRLPNLILRALLINSVISVLFFYFISYFEIAPKIILFIDLIFSFVFILIWRLRLSVSFGFRKKQKAVLLGEGSEVKELFEEVNHNSRYALFFISFIDLSVVDETGFLEVLEKIVSEDNFSAIVLNLKNKKIEPLLPVLYRLLPKDVRTIELYKIYTEVFDCVPLSSLRHEWFLENISLRSHFAYDLLKRMMDILAAVILGILSLVFYPFVFMAIKWDDGEKIFLKQPRVGKDNKIITIYKFRTMSPEENGKQHITRFGSLLRKTRIDELPQLWNVFKGDLSLIGPRPELPHFVELYNREIPYYSMRHIIKPGLSGWAQIHMINPPKFKIGYDETKTKLSYDLYYIKNRSLMLDVKIALLTIRTLLSKSGI